MIVNGKHYRTIWRKAGSISMIDQTLLPFEFKVRECRTHFDSCQAIKNMIVRGAGAIGTAAGYAMAQAFYQAPNYTYWNFAERARERIKKTRPTAQNLFYAVDRVWKAAESSRNPIISSLGEAERIADEDVKACQTIGKVGSSLINDGFRILTHCNAGWLAFTDWGSALAPIYAAHRNGKKNFVCVSETRPRGQGSRLTAWELQNENIPHVIISDNASAYFMSKGEVDIVIVGADRIARNGDVANKIGTLEKAIVAKEFNIPFYVAAPISTFDLKCKTGKEILIEERSGEEVLYQIGMNEKGLEKILVCNPGSKAINPAFDVTPAKYISGIITERGIIKANGQAILSCLGNKLGEN